jgi:hypothetical protein
MEVVRGRKASLLIACLVTSSSRHPELLKAES